MKKLSILITAMLVFVAGAYAQTPYNPYTQNIHFTPEPTAFGFECNTTPSVVFTQGMTTVDDANNWQNSPLVVTVCITGFTFNGTASSVVSGSYAANFDWAFDSFAPNCIVGTQNRPLKGTGTDPFNPDPASSGDVILALKVPETSPIGTVLAVNVNLQVPGYMSQFNSTPDDNESTQTQTFCALKIAGTLYYDTTLVNNSVDGRPFNNPNQTTVYANLVGPNGNVIAVKSIAPNGTYEFLNVTGNTIYTVVLSTEAGVPGNPAPPTTLPPSWINVNEDCCDRIGTDGTANGITTVTVGNASVVNVDFGIYSATPTPVTLSYFFANEQKCKALLTWGTSQEVNSSHVEILRKDGATAQYRKIATVQTNGTSSMAHDYSYLDETVEANGTTYEYVLRFVDFDGKLTSSEVRTLSLSCASSDGAIINVFPNPASGNLNILYITETEGSELKVDVIDLAGRTLTSSTTVLTNGTTPIHVDVSSFAAGSYILRYREVDGVNAGSVKFTKE